MEGCPAGDAGTVLNTVGAERPGFRLRHPSAKFFADSGWVGVLWHRILDSRKGSTPLVCTKFMAS